MNIYNPIYTAQKPNETTEELKALFGEVLKKQPTVTVAHSKKPYADDDRISAIYFNGEEYNGKEAQVFAYIGFPENASAENPVPAMVLVHGGLGKAYAEWVRYWVNNGYAAIAIDGFGQHPADGYYVGDDSFEGVTLNPDSHPTIDEFRSIDKPIKEQWFYHYISDVILANTIIRSDSRVKADSIGITGISWGSVATSFVICFDSRFAFAVPVYGGGFFGESKSAFSAFAQSEKTLRTWDSTILLDTVEMPVLWLNSDCDPFFSADMTAANAGITKNGSLIYAQNFIHGQHPGAYLPEILRFANEQNGLGAGNIKIKEVTHSGNRAILSLDIPEDVKNVKAYVYYRTGEIEYDGANLKKDWKRSAGVVLDGVANVKLPQKAEYLYISVQGKSGRTKLQATTGLYTADYLRSTGSFMKELDAKKLANKINKTAKEDIKSGLITGAQILVNQDNKRIFKNTYGLQRVGGNPLAEDAMYRLASMTKPITAVALLMEAEKGHLSLTDDICKYLDGYDNMYVGKLVDGKVVADKKCENRIKVYQLVAHTSGIGSGDVGLELQERFDVRTRTIASVTDYFKDKPLGFDPGTSEEYNTLSYDVAARIVEITSGMPFEKYLKVNLFDKLGMNDTTFVPSEEQWQRMVTVHDKDKNGNAINVDILDGQIMLGAPLTYFMAGAGLTSTIEDYSKFAQMLLNDGRAEDGTSVISAEMIKLMRTPWVSADIMPGSQRWGLGVRVIVNDNNTLPKGSFGWSGMYGSHFWVDPTNRITAIYAKNSNFDGGSGCLTGIKFEKNVMASL